MSSFLFTTIAAVVGVVMLAPSYATNIPTTNPGCTTTVLGADNVANRSAALEPDFSANTINTTWYSNGTQLTGNGIPDSCTYDEQLLPPTPEARPGYTFGGWKVKVPEPVVAPACTIPSGLLSNNGEDYGYQNDSTGQYGVNSYNTSDYGLTQDNTWGVTWSNGDKVVGEAICSQTNGTYATTGTPDTTGAGTTQYCWCRATGYIASGESQCSLSSSSWVFFYDHESADDCALDCAASCGMDVDLESGFRAAVFAGNVAQ